jgi:hypothetical protein
LRPRDRCEGVTGFIDLARPARAYARPQLIAAADCSAEPALGPDRHRNTADGRRFHEISGARMRSEQPIDGSPDLVVVAGRKQGSSRAGFGVQRFPNRPLTRRHCSGVMWVSVEDTQKDDFQQPTEVNQAVLAR